MSKTCSPLLILYRCSSIGQDTGNSWSGMSTRLGESSNVGPFTNRDNGAIFLPPHVLTDAFLITPALEGSLPLNHRINYDPSTKSQEMSTLMARFRRSTTINPSLSTVLTASSIALSVYQGRCSITSSTIFEAILQSLPAGSPALALPGQGGTETTDPP